jgi:transposase
MDLNELKEIYRRIRDNQSLRLISDATGFDRKTIRSYRDRIIASGIMTDPPDSDELSHSLCRLLPANERSSPIQDSYLAHKDEIINLMTRTQDPLKPKTAYHVVRQKYEIDGSYESFKIFVRKQKLTLPSKKSFPRLELKPGQETQIDYGKCGTHPDPVSGKRRVVYSFVAKLSCSRMPYVEFVYTQTQESFVESHIEMVEFFGGVTEYLTIDNLKAGVIKADVQDPQLNRCYAEFAEHYGTFINPCIPRHAKGKAKVERQVPEVRELFRRLCAIHPSYSLKELNREAKKWCLEEYGQKPHGTTGIPPFEAFKELEQKELKPLPATRFEVPIWKDPKVHMDQFISVDKNRFSLPIQYRCQRVHCRLSGNLMKIYDQDYLFIRQYYISNVKVQISDGDFPESFEAMMQGEYPHYLIRQAADFGPGSKALIESVLRPHAFLNARRALGLLSIIKKYSEIPLLQDVCQKAAERRVTSSKQLTIMLEDEKNQQLLDFTVPRSSTGEAMVRDIKEYFY